MSIYLYQKSAIHLFYHKALLLANPLNMFPVYNILYKLPIFQKRPNSRKKVNYLRKLVARILGVSLCFAVCFVLPSFNKFIAFVGSFGLIFLGLILPILCYYRCYQSSLGKIQLGLLGAMFVINCGIWVSAIIGSILDF